MVRDKLPVRRKATSRNPQGENWSQHKDDLQEDFHFHCGYCGSFDGFRHTYFEVDHFVPKSLFRVNGKIGLCQYDNLVYSCKFCNNKKLSKWPSGDETVPVLNNEGFVDPCNTAYDTHLYRASDGGILWSSDLGKWMATVAFRFDERNNAIKLLWELNQRRKLLDIFVDEMKKRDKDSREYVNIKRHAERIGLEYYVYHKQLMEYYQEIS